MLVPQSLKTSNLQTAAQERAWLNRLELERPGIIDMTWPTGPIFWMLANCSYRIRSVKLPLVMLSISSSFCRSSGTASCISSPQQTPQHAATHDVMHIL